MVFWFQLAKEFCQLNFSSHLRDLFETCDMGNIGKKALKKSGALWCVPALSLLVSQAKFVPCTFGGTIVQLSVYSSSIPNLLCVLITNQLIQMSGADVARLPAFPFIVSTCPSSVLVFFF